MSDHKVRLGIFVKTVLSATLAGGLAVSAAVAGASTFTANAVSSRPAAAQIEVGATPFSTGMGVTGSTGIITEGTSSTRIVVGIPGTILSKVLGLEVSGFGASAPPPGTGAETDPTFTYTGGNLTRIDYGSGHYKVLTYTSGILTQVDFYADTHTRKTLNYSSGILTSITDEVI